MKYLFSQFSVFIFISLLGCSTSFANRSVMTPAQTKEFIKEAYSNAIENLNASDEAYSQFFSKEYIHHINGKTLHFKDFVARIKERKAALKSLKINFKYMIAEGDKIATVHIVDAISKNGQPLKVKVHMLFQIKDRKIVLGDELTHDL